jgi:hypothetical protein
MVLNRIPPLITDSMDEFTIKGFNYIFVKKCVVILSNFE